MWVRLVAAAVAIAVIVGAGWWALVGPGSAPPVDACSAAERAAVRDAPVAFEPTIHWQPAELPEVATDGDEQVMLAVAPRRSGWVATGRTSNGPRSHTFVLATSDGATWQADPADAVRFGGAEIGLLAEFDGPVIAAGSVSADVMGIGVWVGRGSLAWQVASGPFEGFTPTALGAGERSALLLGAADAPAAWSSVSGVSWDHLALGLPVAPELASFAAVRLDDDGWLAVGAISRGVDAPAAPIVWASSDGAAWSCRVLDSAGFEVVNPTGLHRSAQGWLAIGIAGDVCGSGASCVGHAIAWTSPDGVRWSEGRIGVEPWHTGGTAVAGSSEGFVAVGHGTTWWSADGNVWVEIDDGGSGAEALAGQPDALVMTDRGQLAAVGTTYDGADADADAWVATGFLAR